MPKKFRFKDHPKSILMMDDELYNLDFLVEYIEKKGFKVVQADNLSSAVSFLRTNRYAFCIFDVGVPLESSMKRAVIAENSLYEAYPGLFAASKARNSGHKASQVIIYTVHDTSPIAEEAERIGLTYITKGRARMMKSQIDSLLDTRV